MRRLLCWVLPHRWGRLPGYGSSNIRVCARCDEIGWLV